MYGMSLPEYGVLIQYYCRVLKSLHILFLLEQSFTIIMNIFYISHCRCFGSCFAPAHVRQ